MALTKSQTAAKLADATGLTKKQVNGFFDELSKLAYKEAKNSFVVPGLGKLVLVHRKARTGRNPATGETIEPDRVHASAYQDAYQRYRSLYPAIRGVTS